MSGRLLWERQLSQKPLNGVCWSPDGTRLAVSGEDMLAMLTDSGRTLWSVAPRQGAFTALDWSRDGRALAVGCGPELRVQVRAPEDGRIVVEMVSPFDWDAVVDDPEADLDFNESANEARWSPDGAMIATVARDKSLRTWDARTGQERDRVHHSMAVGFDWSPDGDRIVLSPEGRILIVDARSLQRVLAKSSRRRPAHVRWSPDGRLIGCGDFTGFVELRDATSLRTVNELSPEAATLWSIAWSKDGRFLTAATRDGALVWEVGEQGSATSLRYTIEAENVLRVAFSPDGTCLASVSKDGFLRLWDTSDLVDVRPPARSTSPEVSAYVARQAATVGVGAGPLSMVVPPPLSLLPSALAALLRRGRSAPLSLIRDVLALTGHERVAGEAAKLSAHAGVRALASLKFPPPARIALLLLLLDGYEDDSYAPPPGASPSTLRWHLHQRLSGPEQEQNSSTPPLPLGYLDKALALVDDSLLTLLSTLGAEVCAADPALPLTLRAKVPSLVALSAPDRKLLGLRVPSQAPGRAQATSTGGERTGITAQGRLLDLVPSQWALPDGLRAYRAFNGGLIYRAKAGQEPPVLPPLVLVLDTSPSCFGLVEVALRAAAHAVAASLIDEELPGYLVTAGEGDSVFAIEQPADVLHALSVRSRGPARAGAALLRAAALRETLPRGGVEPMIVLFTHPWFGAGEDLPAPPPRLRALFAAYPEHPPPLLHARCERSVVVDAEQPNQLGGALGTLLG